MPIHNSVNRVNLTVGFTVQIIEFVSELRVTIFLVNLELNTFFRNSNPLFFISILWNVRVILFFFINFVVTIPE